MRSSKRAGSAVTVRGSASLELKRHQPTMPKREHLSGEYRIIELHVEKDDWLANKTLAQTRLRDEGVVALAIRRHDGTYIGAPKGEKQIMAGDVLVLYGRTAALQQIDQRQCTTVGDQQHKEAIAAQKQVLEKEKEIDPAERAQSPAGTRSSGNE